MEPPDFISWSPRFLNPTRTSATFDAYDLLGTGKTSLSLALAQQMSIFLDKTYANYRIVQIDAQSIFSKWFSESGKAVSKIFTTIEQLLDQDQGLFLFVLIDEVESLASTRQQEGSAGGGRDEMRVCYYVCQQCQSLIQYPYRLSMRSSLLWIACVSATPSSSCVRQTSSTLS